MSKTGKFDWDERARCSNFALFALSEWRHSCIDTSFERILKSLNCVESKVYRISRFYDFPIRVFGNMQICTTKKGKIYEMQ